MRKLFVVLIVALITASVCWAEDFRVTPYLQNPKTDAITVTWLSESNQAGSITVPGVGTFSSSPVLASDLAYYSTEITKYYDGTDPGTPYLHRVVVEGLSAGTTYTYTVTQGDSTYSSTMKTAPLADGDVRFIVYADSETEPESTGKTRRCSEPYGDYDRQYWLDQTDGYKINIQTMEDRNPDFIAIAGDIVEAGNEQRDWDEFWRHNAGSYNDIAGHVPILPAVGNHENHAGGDGGGGSYTTPLAKEAMARYRTYFSTPDNSSGKAELQGRYYRVDYGPITYITIDSSNGSPNKTGQDTNWYLLGQGESSEDNEAWGEGEAPDFNPGSDQYTWLEAQLADAKETSRFIFVQFHHSPYSVGPHGFKAGSAGQSGGEDTQSGVPMRTLTALFKTYGVDAVFNGHDEMYEHSLVEGIHFFDVGIGGDGLRGPYMGEDGLYDLPSNNDHQVFLAHLNAPETWSGSQLVDGGKHYGHLEVNVHLENGEWQAQLTPVYVFPLMDENGDVQRDENGLPVYERRTYDDVTVLTRSVTDLDDDGDTDCDDVALIRQYLRQSADDYPLYDLNGDGNINTRDARIVVANCTLKKCCENAELLTQPFLQVPSENSVNVVWFTEYEGDDHALIYGNGLEALLVQEDLDWSDIQAFAADHADIQIASAQTMALSRTREDASSSVPDQTYTDVTDRQIWRHEAVAAGLVQGVRVPYAVISFNDCGAMIVSDGYTMTPKPASGTSNLILLTSDHQSKPMTPANMQKVEEMFGTVDAVFFAGDLVNVPDRASEWFDNTVGGAFFPGLQGTAARTLESNGFTTTYKGGKIIQNAPIYPVIGNHEVMGRVKDGNSLSTQFNDPKPVAVAQAAYETVADTVNPSGSEAVKEAWIKDNTFNTDTYQEIFTLPENDKGNEKYYAVTFGDVRLISLYVTRIWRGKSTVATGTSTYVESSSNYDDQMEQGWGRHIFEPIKEGSDQYEWLKNELASDEFKAAKYTIVMLHHPLHSLGDNIIPAFTDPVRTVETDDDGNITSIRYEYPKSGSHLIRDIEPLLEEAGVDLVFNGHDHVWNRFKGDTGVNYLETSNVGNSYGSYVTGRSSRSGTPGFPWNADDYDAYDDPYGLEPITPNVAPQEDELGYLPYLSSNTVTAFTILNTEDGTVTTYAYDTDDPDTDVYIMDRFQLD